PLQMTSAMATIANGGKLVTPRIVKSVTASDGKIVSSVSPVVLRQVISAETAKQIGDALRGVVSDQGTAAAAAVPGFTIAGKTGRATPQDRAGGTNRLNRWFATLSASPRFAVANPSPVGGVKASCSSRPFSLRLQFAKSSGQLIARWKILRMTRGECRGAPCSWRCGVRKPMGTNSSVTPSIKGRR